MSLMPVAEALEKLLAGVSSLETETVSLEQANNRFLAEALISTRTQPPFAASAMDGYAIRHEDLAADGTQLQVIGEAPAGHGFPGHVASGQSVRIFTGAPLPDGADTILIQENAQRSGDRITVLAPPQKGAFVRPAGLDFSSGDVLLEPPLRLDYRHLALAAAMNHAELPVIRKPKVAILATGDELVPPGTEPGPDQIIASNHIGIAALVADCGGQPVDLGISRDEPVELATHIRRAIIEDADILVTLGGASVGDHDIVQEVLGQEGMDLSFWRIAMRPGKPLMAGRLGRTKVLGLPGNPVSSMVCGLLFLKPLLQAMLGQPPAADAPKRAILGKALPENDRRQDYIRAGLSEDADGHLVATPFSRQDSSMLGLLAKSGALIIRPPHAPAQDAGTAVPVLIL
ncbi:gephyrin-like molybdotransferase Glp [Labrenzia sp. 011]|uniref:molybdopterin molybdotransferase MoeA n=1 Tax=Labrenzia sp. 011 TaxID=2171494 RepID=UPI000D51B7DA|nr:gephyrin-like molybdotransferase Glp [Labrenzia sp. 011]PVB62718.1 molybdopterin molybdenumtransferase MoeA [Labrenzia sp. 011]